MSAFIVSDEHIAAMLEFAKAHDQFSEGYYWKDGRFPFDDAAAQKLVDQNYCSVNFRYDETETPHKYSPKPKAHTESPVQILKACNCYDYQACETDDYPKTEAHQIVDTIREIAIRSLPGYEEAQWEIS